jgi:hypothetical protein
MLLFIYHDPYIVQRSHHEITWIHILMDGGGGSDVGRALILARHVLYFYCLVVLTCPLKIFGLRDHL